MIDLSESRDQLLAIGYTKGRIDACKELNELLKKPTTLGYIKWGDVNDLVRKWIAENSNRLIAL